jgi:PAS domain S-box-containing protein
VQSESERVSISNEAYRRIVEAVPEGIWVVDPQGSTIFSNRRMAEILRVDFDSMPQQSCFGCVFPDELEEAQRHFARTLAGDRRPFDFRLRRADGSPIWVSISCMPVYDDTGATTGLLGLFSDITERKQAEATLRESEERLKSAERLAHVGHWHRDLKSGQVTWSEECSRIFGQPLGYAPSQEEFFQLIAPQDRQAVAQGARHCLEENGKSSVEFRIVRPDGELRTVMSVSEVLLNEDGQPGLVFGAFQDITDVKRAQEETVARQKLESLGTLASGIAHDFNNLLGGTLAQAELALEEYQAGSSPVEELKRIRDGAIRGAEIVRQLMIYAGKESEAVGLVDVSQVARGMVELLKVSISKHAALITDFGEDLPAVRGSTGEIQQIVMNLVTNASEALEDRDGVIRVTTRRINVHRADAISKGVAEGDYVELEVGDTGRGMSLETQARVFDPFFTTKSQGHGLGLGVVRGIVKGLGGAIHLESELGKGTTFQILLRSTGVMTGANGPLRTAGEASPPPVATILVVEDDDALRVALAQILRRRCFETLDAANGADAINLLRANSIKIDMMLLDMTIPGPSSREVAAVAAEARPGLKMVLTSAYDEKLVRTTVGPTQACGFVRKPFSDRRTPLHPAECLVRARHHWLTGTSKRLTLTNCGSRAQSLLDAVDSRSFAESRRWRGRPVRSQNAARARALREAVSDIRGITLSCGSQVGCSRVARSGTNPLVAAASWPNVGGNRRLAHTCMPTVH